MPEIYSIEATTLQDLNVERKKWCRSPKEWEYEPRHASSMSNHCPSN